MRFGFLVFNGYSNMVLASAIEPLRAARDIAGPDSFHWQVFSMTGAAVASSSGLTLQCNGRLSDARKLDALFVVSGYGARNYASASTIKALQLAARRVATFGGLDSGAWILAAARLLDNRRATVHWQDAQSFAETHLEVRLVNERYVIDGNRITAGGATSVMELMLHLIGELGGGALAFDVANLFAHDARLRDTHQSMPAFKTHAPPLMKAVAAMRANVERPLSIPAIAAAAAVSPRTLSRLFAQEFDTSPGHYYQQLRLAAARTLVQETALSASEIAERSGFSSPACLSRAFSSAFGRTIKASRQRSTLRG